MEPDQYFRDELAGLERRFRDDGDVAAVAEAIILCAGGCWPLPEWCMAPAVEALGLLNGRSGRGRSQSPRTKLAILQAHRQRHELVRHLLAHGSLLTGKQTTIDSACKEAASMLKGQNVSGDAVRKSYRLVERGRK
jgi:hypothetical protein